MTGPVLESLCKAWNFIKGLQHRYFPVNIAKFLRHLFWRAFEEECFLNSFSTEHLWAAASASLNLGNLLTDYKQCQILS